jgi:NADH-quinone oxidoreductase subunit E
MSTDTNHNPLHDPEKKKIIDQILMDNKDVPGATMVVLNELQSQIGYVSKPMQEYSAKVLGVPVSNIHGVITFYSFFTTSPRGKHTVKFCLGTACYVGGTPQLIDKTKKDLGIDLGETTDDGQITIEACRCVGACSQAPVLVIDEELHGDVGPTKIPRLLKSIRAD